MTARERAEAIVRAVPFIIREEPGAFQLTDDIERALLDTIEECAKVADSWGFCATAAKCVAAEIRKMKGEA